MALTDFVLLIVALGLQQAVPVALAAQGELLTEKSGVLNIGIEGVMLLSAFGAAYVNNATQHSVGPWSATLGIFAGMGIGVAANFLFAFMSTKLQVDQVIAGIGINIFGGGITIVALLTLFNSADRTPLANALPSVFSIPGLTSGGQVDAPEIAMFLTPVLMLLLLYRTTFGLHVRAVGESPKAAEAAGLSVAGTRILATSIGGAFLGLGGAYLSCTIAFASYFTRLVTGGRGFIAISAVIAGAWAPFWVLGVSMIYGMSWGFYFQFSSTQGYTYLFGALPYLVPVAVMAVASKRLRPPSALALPYVKE